MFLGWEGSANDFTMLRDSLSWPQPTWPKMIEGKDNIKFKHENLAFINCLKVATCYRKVLVDKRW